MEGDVKTLAAAMTSRFSIHALRMEGDSKNREKSLCFCFSILHLAQKEKCFVFAV